MPLVAVGRISGVARHERCQVGLGRDRADAGAAAAVRDAEGLVQVQVRDVAAELARLGQPDEGVEVGAVDVDLAAGGVDGVADLADVGVVHTVGGRVGDHDRGQRVLVQLDLGVQVGVVDRAVGGGGHDNNLHAGEHRGGRVGAVRGGRDQADVALGVAAGEVVAADGQQAGELALGPGVGLDGDLVVAGDLGQLRLRGPRSVRASRRSGIPGRRGGWRRTPARRWLPSRPWRSASWCTSPAGSWCGPGRGRGRRGGGCSAAAGSRSGAC